MRITLIGAFSEWIIFSFLFFCFVLGGGGGGGIHENKVFESPKSDKNVQKSFRSIHIRETERLNRLV